jgi:hypothetical protein
MRRGIMNRNSLRSIAGLAFAAGLLLPAIASAQVSAHELSLSGKVLYQQEKNNGDLKVRSESFKIKEIAEVCTDEPLGKKEKVFLIVDCGALGEPIPIQIFNTDPIMAGDEIGRITFDEIGPLFSTKGEETKSATALGTVEIDCEGSVDAEMSGKLEIKYKDIEGESCPNTVKASKLVGAGSFGDEEMDVEGILDNGSLNAKKPFAVFIPGDV